ncbi:MAG TPA: hypothetical protein VFE70_01935, partial [Candidatus Elarobacter sp.]|nr:hypothetical protein [Candidatus Elarobacter sp.]
MRFSASLAALIVATCSAAPAFAQSAATTPKPAAAPTSSYVYAVAVQNGQTCNAPNAADISIVQSVVNSQLRTISPVSDMLPRDASAAPADPLTAAIAELRTRAKSQGNATQKGFPLLYKHNVVVTTLCRNGELDQITSTGYVLIASVDEKIDLSDPAKLVPTVQAGNTITGSLAAVQGADWSNIYGDTKPKNVPFLPVFGDNADVVNGQLEQRLPLVAPKDPTNIVDLCNS